MGKNPIAKDLRTPKYRARIVEVKKRSKKKLSKKEIQDYVEGEL